MRLLWYEAMGDLAGKILPRLRQAVEKAATVEHIDSLPRLEAVLRQAPFSVTTLVLVAADHSQLDQLVARRSLLEGRRLVLVLPDYRTTTLHQAHLLVPRYITALQGRTDELIEVLGHMLAVGPTAGRDTAACA